MEEIILGFKEQDYSDHLRKINKAKDAMQRYLDMVTDINGVKFTQELFASFMGNGEIVEQAIIDATTSQLKAAGINSQSIIDAAIKGDREKYWSLYQKRKVDQEARAEYSGYISIQAGRLTVTADTANGLKEQYTRKIRTEAGKAVYDAHMRMIDAMNEFLNAGKVSTDTFHYSFNIGFGQKKVVASPLAYDELG